MNTSKNIGVFVVILIVILSGGCKKGFLEIVPKDQLSSETLFANRDGADIFLNDIYSALPDQEAGGAYDSWEGWSDNVTGRYSWGMSWENSVTRSYGASTNNPGLYNHGYPSVPFKYDDVYVRIRKCNLFISEVNKNIANLDENWKRQRLAEVRFLRAFYYHWLWMAYGGVPLIKEVLNRQEQGNGIFYPRSSYQEAYQFIIDELNEIYMDLPNEVGTGRATRGAALTLKGWCELYNHKYEDAANTNQQVRDLGKYGLFANYNNQFLTTNNNNKESIFAYQHLSGSKNSGRSGEFGPMPSRGAMQPTQNLVDDYLMKDGLPVTESPLFNPDSPYINRDPRFYQSIVYDGSIWRNIVYYTRQGGNYSVSSNAERHTGYFRRKGINDGVTEVNVLEGPNYEYFRYAEVLLNYAEAKIELNQIDQSVYNAIDSVRMRAGIPTLIKTYSRQLTQTELREIVRRERRIELAFENKRYWDLIRWKTAEIVLNQPKYGINISLQNGKLVYNRFIVHNMVFYKEKNYLFPIFQGWIDQNPTIRAQNTGEFKAGQNPGY
ncbi:RagB/SusD family nutrient uptake outer membrane protein [Niabella aquatica]